MLLTLSLFLAVLQVDGGGLIDGVAVMVVTLAITNLALISSYGWPGHSLASEPPDTASTILVLLSLSRSLMVCRV